jgi:hypothetical protein
VAVSYQIEIIQDIVWVKYLGLVDGLDIIEHYQDPLYVDNIRRYGKVIYDYTQTTDSNITQDEIREFSVLAKIESPYHDRILGVVIPRTEKGRELAGVYIKLLANYNWHLSIANNFAEALKLLSD